MPEAHRVAVVGSANLDIVVYLDRLPKPGETLLGERLEEVAGGKGLNQSIAAARTAETAFVGCIGEDEAGELLLKRLRDAGVDAAHVRRVAEPSGRAFIQLAADGENSIVVMSLANQQLDPDVVRTSLGAFGPAVVLAQLEIRAAAVEAAAAWASDNRARFVLNASPVRDVPGWVLAICDPLVVNTREAESLQRLHWRSPVAPGDDTADGNAFARLLRPLARSVVVTDGARGAHVAGEPGRITHVEGRKVRAVDTTGAGDEFAGALVSALAHGLDLASAAEKANEAAARAVQLPRLER